MTKIKVFQKNTTIKDIVLGTMLVLGLIWLNTFIHQNSFSDGYGDFFFLKNFAIAVFCTGFYFGLFKDSFDGELFCDNTKTCVVSTAITGILMLIAVLLELGTDWFSIYGQKELVFGWLEIPKKYFYDVWTIVWFPINVGTVFRTMKKEHFVFRSILYGCIAIGGLTIEGILLFRPMTNIWLVDLAVLNVATLILAVWKYAISDTNVRKGNVIAGVLLYVIVRACLLPLQCDNWGSGLASFMYAGDWHEVKSVITEVAENASFFGTSEYLKNLVSLHSWLSDWNKPVLQVLYYGGWASVLSLLLTIACLVLVLVKILGIKNGRIHKNWLIYATAVAMLTDRAVFGTLYGFGIPFPVALPFLGKTGIMDSMAFTLILFGAWENLQIQKNMHLDDTFVSAESLLGSLDSYQILDEDNETYEEELLFDDVTVIGNDCKIACVADWYSLKGRAFCVFETRDNHIQGKRFILEFADGRWSLPDDPENEIRKQVSKQYVRYNAPDCMEEEVEFTDEELDDEDSESI